MAKLRRVHCHFEGGGGKKHLTFPGVKAASDVELEAIFFGLKKYWRELTYGPPLNLNRCTIVDRCIGVGGCIAIS